MKHEIQILVANGQTETALAKLAEVKADALLLQARYNNGKKQYNMGLIEFSEWNRTQSQINYAILELASTIPVIAVNHVQNFVYIQNISAADRPGNEYDLFFLAFEAMERMQDRMNYPESEVKVLAETFHRYLGPEFISQVDELESRKFQTNTDAYKEQRKEAIISDYLKLKKEILAEFKTEVKARKKETGWREIWNLFQPAPTFEKWTALKSAIDERLSAAIFNNDTREQWGELSADIDSISAGILWVSRFNRNYAADLKHWITETMK